MRAYQMWDEALAICTRQETPPRGGSGGKRHGPDRRLSGRIPDKQVCFLAWPQDNRWWLASWQWPPHRECQRRCDDPVDKESRGGRRFEHLSLNHHGCPAQPRRWPIRLSCLLIIFCPRAPIRQLSAGRQDAEKPFSSCLCSKKAPTGASFDTSWSCAPPQSTTRPTSSAPGSGWTLTSTF